MANIPKTRNGKTLVQSWFYRDLTGDELLGIVARYEDEQGKKIVVPFFKPDGNDGFLAGIDLNPRPLFGLWKLANQPKDKGVFIVEGEKCATALHHVGLCAVTSLGGANCADKTDWTPLNGFNKVYLLPDNDEVGRGYVERVAHALSVLEQPTEIIIVELPDLPDGGDVVDWLQTFVEGWDGYAAIDKSYHAVIKQKLADEIKARGELTKLTKLTEPPLVSLVSAALGDFQNKNWFTPNELQSKTIAVQSLSDDLLPEPLRAFIADSAYRKQTPPDFVAVSTLVVMGSLIGAGCGIRPKQFDDWEIIPNLWGACIGKPSTLKTPSMKEPMQLLERLQAEYGKQFEQEKINADFESMTLDAAVGDIKTKLKAAAKNGGDFSKLKAEHAELMLSADPELTRRLFKTNETSVQSMTVLQNENPRGLLVFRDELMGLFAAWDREDKADERAYFLEGWNGNGSYTDFKIGRGLTDAKNICISLLGSIQPDKLNRYLYQAMKGSNDGMMQRLQLGVYPDEPQHWQLIDTKPNKEDKERVFNIMQALAELKFTQYGAVQGDYDKRPYFRFDTQGQTVFNDWLTQLQTVKLKQEDNPLLLEHLSKYRSLMPSLALIFHCIDIADGAVTGNVSAKAATLSVRWCDYLESHARRIYGMTQNPDHATAVRLAAKIKAGLLPSPFTARDVERKCWHGLKGKQEIDAACNILIDENWLQMVRKPSATGRPPLPDYFINPILQ
jgi:hypothetical protein